MIAENSVLNARYRLDQKIGQGGFAAVYLGTDLLLERRVAIKVLNPALTEDASFLERFFKEAKAIAGFDHPNILTVFDYGQTDGTAFLVMPYVEGGTLHERLRREKKLTLAQTGKYLQQVAAALDYAHRRSVVHRDIKPQNMLLRAEDDRLLLADFGIAKVLSSASAQSYTGAMGTLSYMSPEQLGGNVGRSTDIYALGCVLFQMLTGQLPYTGPTEQVVMGHLIAPVPSIIERSQGQVPPAVQEVIERALAKKPEERYSSAGDLAKAFQAVVAGISTAGSATVPIPMAGDTQPTQVLNTPPRPSQPVLPTVPQNKPPDAQVYGNTRPAMPDLTEPGLTTPLPPARPLANPPVNSTPPAPVMAPARPLPAKPGMNKALFGGIIGALLLVGVIIGAVIIISNSSPGLPPVPTASPTTLAANAVSFEVTTRAAIVATTAPAFTATAVNTTVPATATLTRIAATPTVAPTTVPASAFNRSAIEAALASLPGTTSAVVLFPDGQTVEDDATRQLPSASTIKLWIAGTFLEEAQAGRVDLSEKYTIKASDNATGTGILQNKVGQTYTYGEILSAMLIYSDNEGANILLDRMGGGLDKVNAYIQRNGYNQTKIQRRLGDVNNPKNNFSSARDASTFMQRLLKGQIVDKSSSDLILKALQDRLAYPADQNYFGPKLGGVEYRHISGVSPGIRNEVGFFYIKPDTAVIVALYTSEVGNEAADEATLATAVRQIYDAAKS
jgi:serine/threonine-protein kinase